MFVAAPQPLLITGLALLGLIVGSFVGLLSVRLPQGEGVLWGRSHCRACGRTLPPWSLVPVLSYLAQRARCPTCRGSVPARYPLMELGCGAIGAWAAIAQPALPGALLTALLGWQLLLLAVIDGEHFWLPDRLTLPLLSTGLGAALVLDQANLRDSLAGAGLGFFTLWALALAYRRLRGREGLGGGDPYLLGAIGAWVGWLGLPSVLLWASAAGLSLVLARRLSRRAVSGSDRLPFGVFLAIGAWMTWLYGPIGL